jgi:DHA2 family multidrug resistance protein
MAGGQSGALLNHVVDQQAFMLSANDIFLGSSVLFVLLIAIIWFARRSGGQGADAAASAAH